MSRALSTVVLLVLATAGGLLAPRLAPESPRPPATAWSGDGRAYVTADDDAWAADPCFRWGSFQCCYDPE